MDEFLLFRNGPRPLEGRLILNDRATDVPGQRHSSHH